MPTKMSISALEKPELKNDYCLWRPNLNARAFGLPLEQAAIDNITAANNGP